MKVYKNLKGISVFIAENLSKATQDKRNSKMDLLKQKRDDGLIVYFSEANLICETWPKKLIHSELNDGDSPSKDESQSNDDESHRAKDHASVEHREWRHLRSPWSAAAIVEPNT